MNRAELLVVGDASWDTTTLVDHVPAPDEKVMTSALVEDVGGVAANSAVAAKVAGVLTRLVTVLGDDAAGDDCVRRLEESGVDVHADRDSDRTARALVLLDGSGEKRLVLAPGNTFYPNQRRCRDLDLGDVTWLHTAAYDRAAAALLVRRCRAAGIRWSVDLEPATLDEGLPALSEVLTGAEVVFCNARALQMLDGHVARLLDMGVHAVVVTRGPDGASLLTLEGQHTVAAAVRPHDVVDTTGAGDCLAGSYVARVLSGDTRDDALRYAVTAASLSCTGLGARPTYPLPVTVCGSIE